MSPSELNRQVAAATGESVAEIRTRGFSIHNPAQTADESEVGRQRRRRRRRRAAQRHGNSS